MALLHVAARSCKRLKHLVIRPRDSAEWGAPTYHSRCAPCTLLHADDCYIRIVQQLCANGR